MTRSDIIIGQSYRTIPEDCDHFVTVKVLKRIGRGVYAVIETDGDQKGSTYSVWEFSLKELEGS